MTDVEPRFTARDVIEIASRLTVDDGTFLVGGQAVALWAWFYAGRYPGLELDGSLTSKDIDYFGTRQAAESLAAAIGGRAILPDHSTMNSPNTAVVVGTVGGKPIRIDFLHCVLGLRIGDLGKCVSVLTAEAVVDGVPRSVDIPVLHPVACLRSRVANMLSPATMRRDALAWEQLRAAEAVVVAYVLETLEAGDHREAQATLSDLFAYARSDAYGRRARQELGTDVGAIIERFLAEPRLDERYREMTLRPMVERLAAREASRERRHEAVVRIDTDSGFSP